VHSHVNGHVRHGERSAHPRSSLEGLGIRAEPVSREPSSPSDGSWDEDDDGRSHDSEDNLNDAERKMRDEAKSNRKIADLEITTRSLLAINSSLEAAKHRQAKEIRDLKRKLRESRLILPPPAYRAVKSSLPPDETAEEEDIEEDDDEQTLLEGTDDEPYRRVKLMVDGLLESCRRALAAKPEDFVEGSKGGAKVLSAEEVRSWRGDDADVETRSLADPDVDDASSQAEGKEGLDEPSSGAADLIRHKLFHSEDGVEASLREGRNVHSTTLPPITVTPSP